MKRATQIACTVVLATCAVQTHAQAALYSNNFQDTNDLLPEWSDTSTDTTSGTGPHQADRFLGQFVNDTATLTLTGLGAHDSIVVSFDLYVIGTWDGNGSHGGEVWEVSIRDAATVFWRVMHSNNNALSTGFSNMEDYGNTRQAYPEPYPEGDNPARTGAAENNTLGFEYYDPPRGNPITDSVYHIQTDPIAHTESSLQLRFSASGLQDVINPGNNAWDESWGLDNVIVTPEPVTLVMLVLGGLTVLRRRRVRS